MRNRVSRTIELKHVHWITNKNVPTLEDLLRDIWLKRNKTTNRIVKRDDGTTVQGLHLTDYRNSGHPQKCIAVHFVRFTDGQSIGVVPKDDKTNSTIASKPPEENENYLEQDFVILVKLNSVIMTSASLNKGAFKDFVSGMVKECGFLDHFTMFDLISVADGNKLELIKQHGVKNLRLNMSISDVVMSQIEDTESLTKKAFGIPSLFNSIVNALAKKDKSLADYAKDSESKVEIMLKVKSDEIKPVREGIDKLARQIVSSTGDNVYEIELNNKKKLSLDSIKHRKNVSLRPNASTFSVDDAITKMLEFYDELEESGEI